VTATLSDVPLLAVGDVLGSASVNVLILAVGDAVLGRHAVTSVQGSAGVMLQGVIGIALLAMVAAATTTGDVAVLGMGVWSWLMLASFALLIRLLARSQADRVWRVESGPAEQTEGRKQPQEPSERGLSSFVVAIALAGSAILAAGFVLAQSGQALAEQTGLGASFFGVVFLALSTSLPEWSTVIESIRLERYDMAIGDVFGTNVMNVMIIVLIDALNPGDPVLQQAGRFAGFAAVLAIVLTSVFMIGLLERRDRTVLRMGHDSLVVVLAYAAGVVVLHGLR
jgi:cation:H+ antiporter